MINSSVIVGKRKNEKAVIKQPSSELNSSKKCQKNNDFSKVEESSKVANTKKQSFFNVNSKIKNSSSKPAKPIKEAQKNDISKPIPSETTWSSSDNDDPKPESVNVRAKEIHVSSKPVSENMKNAKRIASELSNDISVPITVVRKPANKPEFVVSEKSREQAKAIESLFSDGQKF